MRVHRLSCTLPAVAFLGGAVVFRSFTEQPGHGEPGRAVMVITTAKFRECKGVFWVEG
jgi:hypothetical protein